MRQGSLFSFLPSEKYTQPPHEKRLKALSFDRRTAATREDILFFAPGDPVYDSIISNAVGCNRGRCTGIETVAAYNYDGLVFIYNIAPKLDELLENGMTLQTLAQYRMYLPLKQIIVTVPLTARSKEVPEKEIINISHLLCAPIASTTLGGVAAAKCQFRLWNTLSVEPLPAHGNLWLIKLLQQPTNGPVPDLKIALILKLVRKKCSAF